MRPVLPPAVDVAVNPDLARVVVPCRAGDVEVALVLLVAPSGAMVGALWALGGRCVDATIGDA